LTIRNLSFLILNIFTFLEGVITLAIQVAFIKVIAPFFGNTVYVWSLTLLISLLSLSLGYFISIFLFSNKKNVIILISILISVHFVIISFFNQSILNWALDFETFIGIAISCLLIITPILIFNGVIIPIIINFLEELMPKMKNHSGNTYGISTFGGIIGVLIFSLYIFPYYGLQFSFLIILGISLISILLLIPLFLIQIKYY
jgi:hypothetical protein